MKAMTLNDGNHIPQLGFGVYQISPEEMPAALGHALEVGYRHVDTAQMYRNEKAVGEVIKASSVDRADVFITSKLNNGNHLPDDARRSFEQTLKDLDTDYVDLFLIHWPLPTLYDGDFVSTWQVLEAFRQQGRARSIGVSNFEPAHIDRLLADTDTVPAVNQVEVHPYFQNETVRQYNQQHDIITEAWSPIAKARVLGEKVVTDVAEKYGKIPAQVVLRWHIERGDVVFPKSATPSRIEENFAIFDFELSADDVAAISGLAKGEAGRIGGHPDSFAYLPEA